MFQFVFVGITAYFIFNEIPTRTFYLVSFFLTLSGIVAVAGTGKQASLSGEDKERK